VLALSPVPGRPQVLIKLPGLHALLPAGFNASDAPGEKTEIHIDIKCIHMRKFCVFILFLLLPLMIDAEDIICPPDMVVGYTTPPFPLSGGIPEGGLYSGEGVILNVFYPAEAGSGVHEITYTVFSTLQILSCTFLIQVNDLPQQAGYHLQAGLQVLPWTPLHYFSPSDDKIRLRLLGSSPGNGITQVTFYFSTDGTNWTDISTDMDGSELIAPGPVIPGDVPADGWSACFTPDYDLFDLDSVWFKADVMNTDGTVTEVTTEAVPIDMTPPSGITVRLGDDPMTPPTALPNPFFDVFSEIILVDIDPNQANIDSVGVSVRNKPATYSKNIPKQGQWGENDCGPVALAACFHYFANNGDDAIMGGMTPDELADSLKILCGTIDTLGTYDNMLARGARTYLSGKGYFVRFNDLLWEDVPGNPYRDWLPSDMQVLRNELERSQNIIVLFNWIDDQGKKKGHYMTMNSITNNPLENGNYQVGFMDPMYEEYTTGEIDPQTGTSPTGFTNDQGDVFPPAGAEIASFMIICPVVTGPVIQHTVVAAGPDPDTISFTLPDFGTYWIDLTVKDLDGHLHNASYPIRYAQPQAPLQDYHLQAGLQILPWMETYYLSPLDEKIRLRLLGAIPDDDISQVNFYCATDDDPWQFISTDYDGNGLAGPGPQEIPSVLPDGWSAYFAPDLTLWNGDSIRFKAEVIREDGTSSEFKSTPVHPVNQTPPAGRKININDFTINKEFDQGFALLTEAVVRIKVDPGTGSIDSVGASLRPKTPVYSKNIPKQGQWGQNDCGPVALAACFHYFANQGDTAIMGGMTPDDLADSLKILCGTIDTLGTYDHMLARGARTYLSGKGYFVRFNDLLWEDVPGSPYRDWLPSDMQVLRRELERSQNIIVLFTWTDAEGKKRGHYMTMNSIVNDTLANGNYQVGFMDPMYEEYNSGEIDPETGSSSTGFTNESGDVFPPAGAQIASFMIICPVVNTPVIQHGVYTTGPDPDTITLSLPDYGTYWIDVTVKDPQGYVHTSNIPVRYDPPQISCPPDTVFITYHSSPFPLNMAKPSGGNYSGTGVFNNTFYPFLAGYGSHTISYEVVVPGAGMLNCTFTICVPDPDITLTAGHYVNPADWHNWIGPDLPEARLRIYGGEPAYQIDSVVFHAFLHPDYVYNPDISWPGMGWPGNSDHEGGSYGAHGPLDLTQGIDGWSAALPMDIFSGTDEAVPLFLEASVHSGGKVIHSVNRSTFDPSPVTSVSVNIEDGYTTQDSEVMLTVESLLANINHVMAEIEAKPDSFAKGIPNVQTPGMNNCGPAALTACFRWFANQGDTGICSGFSNSAIIDSLRKLSGVSGGDPIAGDELVNAALKWLSRHGNEYEIRDSLYEGEDDDGNLVRIFHVQSWRNMRNELEKGQNVISLFNWDSAGVELGHFMTFNSIVNRPLANGHYRVDYMDPATGTIIYGELDPANGSVSNFYDADSNNYPPDGARITENIIICPKVTQGGPSNAPTRLQPITESVPWVFNLPLPEPGLYRVHLHITDLDMFTTDVDLVVERLPLTTLSGVVHYDNTDETPLAGVTVNLTSDGTFLQSATTDSAGGFVFSGLQEGTYTLQCESQQAWGGGNSIDALKMLRHFVELDTLRGMPLTASDLDMSGLVNANDGLLMLRRFTGLIDAFTLPDWLFEEVIVDIPAGQALVNRHIKAICAGDANASWP